MENAMKTIYEAVLVEGRWYVMDTERKKTAFQLSFTDKRLADMMCANLMGYTIDVYEKDMDMEAA